MIILECILKVEPTELADGYNVVHEEMSGIMVIFLA